MGFHQVTDEAEVGPKTQQRLSVDDDGRRDETAHESLQFFHVGGILGDVPFLIGDACPGKVTLCRMTVASGGLGVDDDF